MKNMRPKVKFYMAEFCPYCKEVYREIMRLKEMYDFDLEIYEYTRNPEAFKDIDKVPTIIVDDKEISIELLEPYIVYYYLK